MIWRLYLIERGDERHWMAGATAADALREAREHYRLLLGEGEVKVTEVDAEAELRLGDHDQSVEELRAALPPGGRLDGRVAVATARVWAAWAQQDARDHRPVLVATSRY